MRQVDDMGAVYLAAENSRVTTHTAALLTLDPAALPGGTLTIDQLRDLVRQRLHLIAPFRWRLARVPFGLDHPYWVEDPEVDLDFHVREVSLPSPGSDEQLRQLVARIFARRLDRSRPLWETYLIRGLPDGRVAVLTKVHHAAADGLSGEEILVTLADTTPEPRSVPPPPPRPVPRPPGDAEMLVRGIAGLARRPWRALAGIPDVLVGLAELPVLGTLPGARQISTVAAVIRRQQAPHFAVPRAPRTSFNGRVSAQRRLGFGTLSLDDVKRVKNHFGVSVNDVVMALSAGALRRWLVEHDELPDASLTAVVPVSTRGAGRAGSFGNKVSAIVVPIPTDVPDVTERLARAHQVMDAAKAQLGSVPADVLADVTYFFPPAVFVQAAQLLTTLNALPPLPPAMNVNISNVPGPREPLYYAGAKVESMVPLAGISDGLGLNITVLSYCARIDVGIVADREQVEDVQRIADWMADDLAELVEAAKRGVRARRAGWS
ncbi:MAG TPA: wax ester/triacylglycerol synthase family O-acyltransferase [Kribbella sp.]|nr:wax ester/triacylglycerol synthase family O-acyltransferase [Kribbella sp.]